MRSRILVSFDFELAWGTHEFLPAAYLRTNVARANEAALRVFEVNEAVGVPAIWAVVGAAVDPKDFAARCAACRAIGVPVERLIDQVKDLGEPLREAVTRIPAAFLEKVAASRCQRLGCHSYAHGYADRVGPERYREDFAAFAALGLFGDATAPRLFIAPKNIVPPFLKALAEECGFAAVRVNPRNWLYGGRPGGKVKAAVVRVLRFADAFLPINECFEMMRGRVQGEGELEGNFFFRPVCSLPILDALHRLRLRVWARFAIATGRDVHVWTHPHNFGSDVERGLENYRKMVGLLKRLEEKHQVGLSGVPGAP